MHARSAAATETRDRKARLIELIGEKCLLKQTDVRLVSGAKSTFYFDMKCAEFDPEATNLIADLILEALSGQDVDLIGGLAMGAVPIVACVSQKSYASKPVPGFFVRKEVKDHGTRRRIEGLAPDQDPSGKRAVLIEDVTTTGTSVLLAVEAAKEAGCVVDTVITVVDREEGAAANLAEHGLRLIALTTAGDYEL